MNLHLRSVTKALADDSFYMDFNARYMNLRPHLRRKVKTRHKKASHRYSTWVMFYIDKKTRIRFGAYLDSRKIEPQITDRILGCDILRTSKRKTYRADRRVWLP